tara:strand:+ start:2841 stop:3518 length:678 start_codon:yes stop_codon:yes gene_type:complete
MSSLKENNRWKIDTKEKKSFEQRKRKKDNKNDRYKYEKPHIEKEKKEEELNINSIELFPSLEGEKSKNIDLELKNKYLEKIKIQKELEEEKNKNILKDGWVAYRMKKGSNNIQVSRNGTDYYDSLRETYTDEEWEKKEYEEFQNQMNMFSYRMEELYLKRKKESDDYYYDTGKLDAFALAEKDRLEYEEYLKKFEEQYENIEESSDDETIDDDNYNSDGDFYKKR